MNEKNICFCCGDEVFDDFVLVCYDNAGYDNLENYSVVCPECFERDFAEDDCYIMHFGDREIGYLPKFLVKENDLDSNPLFEKIKDEYYLKGTEEYFLKSDNIHIMTDCSGTIIGYTNVSFEELFA